MHARTEYSCMRIEVTSCISIWMDYAAAGSPVSCVGSIKNFQLQLVAEKACMVYVRKYRCTGAVMGLQFKLLTWKQTHKAPCRNKMHGVFTRNTHVTMSILCKFTQTSSLGSFSLFVCFEKCHFLLHVPVVSEGEWLMKQYINVQLQRDGLWQVCVIKLY